MNGSGAEYRDILKMDIKKHLCRRTPERCYLKNERSNKIQIDMIFLKLCRRVVFATSDRHGKVAALFELIKVILNT